MEPFKGKLDGVEYTDADLFAIEAKRYGYPHRKPANVTPISGWTRSNRSNLEVEWVGKTVYHQHYGVGVVWSMAPTNRCVWVVFEGQNKEERGAHRVHGDSFLPSPQDVRWHSHSSGNQMNGGTTMAEDKPLPPAALMGELVGHASMLWSNPRGAGTYDLKAALAVADRTLKAIQEQFESQHQAEITRLKAAAEQAVADRDVARAQVARVQQLAEDLSRGYGPGSHTENVMGQQSVTIETVVRCILDAIDINVCGYCQGPTTSRTRYCSAFCYKADANRL